ncbi:MAG: hypothetical protein ACRDE7_12100, partial [Sphingobacterium sp.]
MSNVYYQEKFEDRHNGPSEAQVEDMLAILGANSLDELIEQTVPAQIRKKGGLKLPKELTEVAYLAKIAQIAEKNKVFKSYIGQGYNDVILPGVI